MSASKPGPGAGIRIENVALPAEGEAIRVDAAGRPVALFRVGGQLLAVDAACTHVGGPLDEGSVSGSTVTCPWHGSQFDLSTGSVQRGPAQRAVRSYAVSVEGTTVVLTGR